MATSRLLCVCLALLAVLAPALAVADADWNPTPKAPVASFPFADNCVLASAPPTGTVDGTVANRQITIQAKDGAGAGTALSTDKAQFVVEAYTNSPSCYPYATTPNCQVMCTPWAWPNVKSPSCLSVPHVWNSTMQLNPADLYTVPAPQWSVGTVTYSGGNTYVATYFPERKDNYDISVMLVEKGGLYGLYYDNVWFLNAPTISRVDPTINFQWGIGAITTFGADYVAVRWTGKVRPDFTEPYTFYLYADEGARLWIDKVLVADSWSAISNETFGTVLLQKGFFHDIIIEYKELTGAAFCELRWSSYSVPKQIIAKDNLYTTTHISGSPFMNITIGAGAPAYNQTTVAWGTGLSPSSNPGYGKVAANVVGVLQQFLVQAFDVYGNVQDGDTTAANGFTFTVTPLQTSQAPTSSFVYSTAVGNSTYNATYTTTTTGLYRLSVTVSSSNYHISGSPWVIYAAPAATHSPTSRMWGGGLTYAMAASASQITIQARDRFDNNRTMSTDFVQLIFTGSAEATNGYVSYGVDASSNDGYYSVQYTPQQSGPYSVKVMLNGVEIIGSPFNVVVVPAVAWGPTSFCTSSTDAMRNATTLAPAVFTLSSRDIYNNVVTLGGAKVIAWATLVAPSTPSPLVQVLPISFNATVVEVGGGSGQYTLSYTPMVAGTWVLSVKMNDQDVMFSPFALNINPNVPAVSSSVTTGSGLSQGVTGIVYDIYVQARDAAQNNQLDSQVGAALNTFSVELACPNPIVPAGLGASASVLPFNVTYVGRATFKFTYIPTLSYHACVVNVKLYGTAHVPGSPFPVTILPGPALFSSCTLAGTGLRDSTTGVPANFTMTAFDQYRNPVTTGAVPLFYNISQPYIGLTNTNLSTSQTIASWAAYNTPVPMSAQSMVDLGTGQYLSTYTVQRAGNYSLNVFMPSQGGLRGSYYSCDYFAGSSLYSWRVDTAVDFNWGYLSPFTISGAPANAQTTAVFPADMFSVVWSGKLLAPSTEVTRFYLALCANVGARLQINGQMVVDAFSPLLGASEPFGDLLLTSGQYYDVLIFFKAGVGNASISWSWSTPSRNKTVVPSTALYFTNQFAGSPYAITIWPNVIVPATTTVITTPLPYFIAGVQTSITIQARDLYGNNQWNSTTANAAGFSCTFTGVPTSATVNALIQPMALGVYNVTWTPPSTGMQVLNILFNGVSIGGMPRYVNVAAGLTVPARVTLIPRDTIAVTMSSTTSIYSTSLTNTTAGVWTLFTIQSRDVFSNTRGVGGDQYTVVLVGQAGSAASGVNSSAIVADNGDSTYNVSYRCPVAGAYKLYIYLNNTQPVASSPYSITVSPAAPFANTTRFTGTQPLTTAGVNVALAAEVTMYDQFNNKHTGGGNNLFVRCTDNYNSTVRGTVTDGGAGVYTLAYTLTRAKQWQCFVLVVDALTPLGFNQPNGLLGQYFNNRWLQAPAAVTRIDPIFNFQWGTDLITPTAANYVSAQWTGFIKATAGSTYTFFLNADDSVRLFVDNTLIIDTWKLSAPGEVSGTYTFPTIAATPALLYEIVLQYRQNTGFAFLNMSWSCAAPSIAKQLIPMQSLFSGATNIAGSPFLVNAA